MTSAPSQFAERTLRFDIQEYWLVGAGSDDDPVFDASPMLDSDGLPCISGRGVKGLLRAAVRWLEDLGHLSANGKPVRPSVPLFGGVDHAVPPNRLERFSNAPGIVRCGAAVVPESLRRHLIANRAVAQVGLFESIASTSLDDEHQVRPRHLRLYRVTVPITIEAPISFPQDEDTSAILSRAARLIRGIGLGRKRGLGRVVTTLLPPAAGDPR